MGNLPSTEHAFQAFSGSHGYESYIPPQSACTKKENHYITVSGQTYGLERYVTAIYANRVLDDNQNVELGDYATIISGSLFQINKNILGSTVVQEGQITNNHILEYGRSGLMVSSGSDVPVATVALGDFAFSAADSTTAREIELNFDQLGACLGLYKNSSGQYLNNKQLVLVLPKIDLF